MDGDSEGGAGGAGSQAVPEMGCGRECGDVCAVVHCVNPTGLRDAR